MPIPAHECLKKQLSTDTTEATDAVTSHISYKAMNKSKQLTSFFDTEEEE